MIAVRAKQGADQAWVEDVLTRWWGSRHVIAHGQEFDAARLPALIVGERQGLLTYAVMPPRAEIITLNALQPRQGIGSALIAALAADLAASRVRQIRPSMTNHNLDPLRFYPRRRLR